MADTTFTNAITLTDAEWFNDLNDLYYTTLGGQAGTALAAEDALAALQKKGADIASAATINLDTATGDFVHITGSTGPVTAITLASGDQCVTVFDSTPTLTYNATTLILPTSANIVAAAGDAAIWRGDGAGNARCIAYFRRTGAALASSGASINDVVRSARTSNTALADSDKGTWIDVTSGTFTQTYGSLTAGFWCYYGNSGTGVVTQTSDGVSNWEMYPGELRLFQYDGSTLRSRWISQFYKSYLATATFVKPPGYAKFGCALWAAGASGRKDSGANNKAGGGGGACALFELLASALGATETVTIGAGGAAQTVDATNGNVGGNSTFVSISADGGGVGNPALGGSAFISGVAFSANHAYGGAAAGANQFAFLGGGTSTTTASVGKTVWGGAAGGAITSADALINDQTTIFGGARGDAVLASNGVAGTQPGGGGGATKSGTQSGAGADGELRIWGIA